MEKKLNVKIKQIVKKCKNKTNCKKCKCKIKQNVKKKNKM